MKKSLLFGLMASAAISASAVEVGDYVYTNVNRYQITGADLVTNGNFADKTLAGWTVIPSENAGPTDVFEVVEGTDFNTIRIMDGKNALTDGIYQSVDLPAAGTYVISMKLYSASGATFTDFDMTGSNVNYINAYYQSDAETVLAYTDGTNNVNLQYGTDGIGAAYQVAFDDNGFKEVNFAIDAPADGNLIIDIRGLKNGVEIANVEVHAASLALDRREAQVRSAWVKTILNGFDWTEDYEYYEDVRDGVDALDAAIAEGSDNDVTTELENLNTNVDELIRINMTDVLRTINGAKGGNQSANWMDWTSKYNKCNDDGYTNTAAAGWSWSTDRWAHKTAAANSPLQIQWMRGSSGTWDNIATCTTTLDKGSYFFTVQGAGGMMTLNKQRWARSLANQCAETQLFFNNDTTEVFYLPTDNAQMAKEGTYIYKFEVAEDATELTFGIRCNIGLGLAATDGFDVNFLNPAIYKVNVLGQLTEEQKAYLGNVDTQMEALAGRIEVAKGYVAAEQTERPWGKEDLQKGIDETQKRYDVWAALDQDAKLETMDAMYAEYSAEQAPYYVDGAYVAKDSLYTTNNDTKALANIIMNAGVRYINNEFINVFTNVNAPLTDMPGAIAEAQKALNSSAYATGDKETFEAAINAAQTTYDNILATTSQEKMEADAATLVEAKATLEAAVEAFKKSAEMTPIASFDFENGYSVEEDGEIKTYVIKSNEGTAKFVFAEGEFSDAAPDAYAWGTAFEIALSKSPAVNEGKYLIIGGTANKLELPAEAVPTDEDVLRIDMTMYYPAWGNSIGNPEFLILSENEERIGGFIRGTWNAVDYCSFGLTGEQLFNSNKNQNNSKLELKDCYALTGGARVDYQLMLDYKAKKMIANTVVYKGDTNNLQVFSTTNGDEVDFGEIQDPAKYISMRTTGGNSGRRASIDDLKIYKYKSTSTGINDVTATAANVNAVVKSVVNGQVLIKTAKGTFNAAGAQVK